MAGRLSKVGITSEFPDYYKTLSRRLYRVLEDIGASTLVRDVTIKTMTTNEILQSVACSMVLHQDISFYMFGSSFEGTTTPDLKSDVDIVSVIENLPVVTNREEAQQNVSSLLLVQDSHTPAGYTKLQYAAYGKPLTTTSPGFASICPADAEGRLVFTPSCVPPNLVQHGPAQTTLATKFSSASDNVSAVRSRAWPDCASEWFTRQRLYNWPSQEQIDKCKTFGCFFVRVGHPDSDENHIQWRISFSLQERLLVSDFISVQLKCYILLKMIKNEMVHKKIGGKYLTSYHFKTCLLYLIENTPAEFWTEENLLVCLHRSLLQMLVWVETGQCPNYFIPAENMFEGRVSEEMQIRICELLRILLSANFMFLLTIKTDRLGNRYQEALELGILAPRHGHTVAVHCLKSSYAVYKDLWFWRNIVIYAYQNTCSQTSAQNLCTLKDSLQRTNTVSEHSITETREALAFLVPYIDIALMSAQIVVAKRMSESNEYIFSLLASEQWNAASLESDPFSSKLKQASLMHMLGHCELSLEILQGLQDLLDQQLSVCGCYGPALPCQTYLDKSLPAIARCSYEELLRRHFIPCQIYLPAERDLTPHALNFEMYRSVGSPPEGKQFWYDSAVVDGKVLLYFLLYLNHHSLGMEADAATDLDNILLLIRTDRLLCHRETAFNLLGWINKERGFIDTALECFRRSLILERRHNAALWHVACVLSGLINSTNTAGTRRQNDVVLTSMRRNVASTSV